KPQRKGKQLLSHLLLLCFPVASSLHSSRVLAGTLGGSITHQCFYTPSPANQHQRKYWCKITEKGLCSTIISSSFTSSQHQGRVALRDVPQNGTITVTMTGLRSSDSGTYRCGIGSTNRGALSGLLAELWGQTQLGKIPKSPSVPRWAPGILIHPILPIPSFPQATSSWQKEGKQLPKV
uniref:Ig-like domain-containing protein n=1 Tax=Junco hyemalis TaxID=40217 RepID=A0A8C5JQ12_JUNHY